MSASGQLDFFLPHGYEGRVIEQRARDGYINATAMCQAAGRPWSRYWENRTTRDFAQELASDLGIPISELIESVRGGEPHRQGTWVHPQVAIHLAQWLSAKFAVQVSKWIHEWMSAQGGRPRLPYHLQRYVANQRNVPRGHFSVLTEMAIALIGPLEAQGYTLPEHLWPDISQGRMFARWLRDEHAIDTNAVPTYQHEFADGRASKPAKAYPNDLLPEFRTHLETVWLPQRAAAYFAEKDPAALPFLAALVPAISLPERPSLSWLS